MRYLFRSLSACVLTVFLVVLVAGVASAQQESTDRESTDRESTQPESTKPTTESTQQQAGTQPESLIVRPDESIQEAVDTADPGDTIVVLGGVHRETVVIEKDGIALRGVDTSLRPPAEPAEGPCEGAGFCVLGDVDFDTSVVSRYVEDVSISGFRVRGFEFTGIVGFGTRDAKFVKNRTFNNGEYGITAFFSTGTQVISNVTSGSEDAGIYIGDSRRANATVAGNDTHDNALGVLVRNARRGQIVGNEAHDNCVGILFVAGAPGPAGRFDVSTNTVRENTRSCPETDEAPAFSGVGIGLLGATGVEISGNHILGNVASGPTEFEGGVVVVSSPIDETPPTDNSVFGNVILNNEPDIFWDETGSGNTFVGNDCETSDPEGLCEG
jgi:nitrous oxidase accessory protein NosD